MCQKIDKKQEVIGHKICKINIRSNGTDITGLQFFAIDRKSTNKGTYMIFKIETAVVGLQQ